MEEEYLVITRNIIKKVHNENANFYEMIKWGFDEANKIDNINGINEVFVGILRADTWTIDQVKSMIDMGADPHYNNDLPFALSCVNKTTDVPIFLINQYGVNNSIFEEAFNMASDINRLFLIHNGLVITDKIIRISLRNYNHKLLHILMEKGISTTKMLEIYSEKYFLQSFEYNYSVIPHELCLLFLNELKNINICINKNFLTALLISLVSCSMSIADVDLLVNMGANPKFNNDIIFNHVKYHVTDEYFKELISYFVYECNCDINIRESLLLSRSLETNNVTKAKILLDMGITISKKVIESSFIYYEGLLLLLNHNVKISDCINILLECNYLTHKQKIGILKILVKNGIDLNDTILGL